VASAAALSPENMTVPPDANAERSRPQPRRTLVTGGAGFIGSHLVGMLLDRGDAVTVIDNLSTGRRANLPEAHERLRFIEADLGHALGAFGKGEVFDEIYHLAAAVGVQLVMREPIRSIETNIEETAALLRFAGAHSPDGAGGAPRRSTPTLIASSSEVYGKSPKNPFSEEDDGVYGPTTIGRWSYACSKAIDEYLGLAHHRQHGLPTVIVRLFNTVGPRQVGDYGMVVPRFVGAALKGEPLPVYGDGAQERCFCDVRDVAAVLPRLLATPACFGRVFNVGSDRPISIRALADQVLRITGSSSSVKFMPYSEVFPPGFEDLQKRQPDLTRIRAVVDFQPRIPLEQTIRDVAAYIAGGAGSRGARG
jgi:UDP-glucose 4-epimerase